jgi:hypothetical protein
MAGAHGLRNCVRLVFASESPTPRLPPLRRVSHGRLAAPLFTSGLSSASRVSFPDRSGDPRDLVVDCRLRCRRRLGSSTPHEDVRAAVASTCVGDGCGELSLRIREQPAGALRTGERDAEACGRRVGRSVGHQPRAGRRARDGDDRRDGLSCSARCLALIRRLVPVTREGFDAEVSSQMSVSGVALRAAAAGVRDRGSSTRTSVAPQDNVGREADRLRRSPATSDALPSAQGTLVRGAIGTYVRAVVPTSGQGFREGHQSLQASTT